MFLAKKSNKSSISTKGIKALLTSVLASTISPFARLKRANCIGKTCEDLLQRYGVNCAKNVLACK